MSGLISRQNLEKIFRAGIAAVEPGAAVGRNLRLESNGLLRCGGRCYDLGAGRCVVAGAGKGAAPMAAALENLLGDYIESGFAVVKTGHALPLGRIAVAEAAHPTPDAAGERAARKILELAAGLGSGDLMICLLTGGASSLTACPAEGVTLEDLQAATRLLLAAGADISQINALRKHLSAFGGGQLARLALRGGAQLLALIVSDVIGDDLSVIASGPTAPDTSTFAECVCIAEKFGILSRLPSGARERLEAGAAGLLPETPKPGAPYFSRVNNVLIARNRDALCACAREAESLGYRAIIEPEPMQGEARKTAERLVERARCLARSIGPAEAPICLLAGGETTVSLHGSGMGGRNQEMALAAKLALHEDTGSKISALFAGTDGTDGPTDAAGGFAFASRAGTAQAEMDFARECLANNDSYRALGKMGDLLITGPTLTNVMDLAILLVEAG